MAEVGEEERGTSVSRRTKSWMTWVLVLLGLTAAAGVGWRLAGRGTHPAAAQPLASQPPTRRAQPAAAQPPPDSPRCRTPEELRKACAELLTPYPALGRGEGRHAPMGKEPSRLFIVDYLDSPDPALRDEAVDILAEAPKRIPSSAFTKYLSDRYPRDLRAMALARSLAADVSEEEFHAQTRHPEDPPWHKRMRPLWSKVFADLAREPDPPSHFFALAVRLGHQYAEESIPEPDFPRIVRWCLGLLSHEREYAQTLLILHGFPDRFVAPGLADWYPAEKDRDARLRAVREYAVTMGERNRRPLFEPFLKLAGRDSDPEIADVAKRALTSH